MLVASVAALLVMPTQTVVQEDGSPAVIGSADSAVTKTETEQFILGNSDTDSSVPSSETLENVDQE